MIELACLYREVRIRFFDISVEDYVEAMSEVSNMANSLGFTLNDLAKINA